MFHRMLLALILLLPLTAHAERESWYQNKYCEGIIEFVLPDKARVDCLTEGYAIEYDFGYKWAECVGQALYYAIKTNRLPGCVLINLSGKYSPAHLERLLTLRMFGMRIWLADESEIREIVPIAN